MKKLCLGIALALSVLSLCGCTGKGEPNVSFQELPAELPAEPLPEPEPLPSEPEPLPEPQEHEAEYLVSRADGLNIRTGAGTEYPVLGQAERGVLLRSLGTENGWHRTEFRGKTAYVSAAYTDTLRLPAASEEVERVIEEGFRLLGTPYVYGAVRFHDGRGNRTSAFTEEAFDCSSLMQYVFYRGAGVLLGVTTRTQVVQGERREEPERGDLLFFTNAARCNRSGIERVGHVALYLGGGYILHTSSDYAKAERLSEARMRYFLEARRVL